MDLISCNWAHIFLICTPNPNQCSSSIFEKLHFDLGKAGDQGFEESVHFREYRDIISFLTLAVLYVVFFSAFFLSKVVAIL